MRLAYLLFLLVSAAAGWVIWKKRQRAAVTRLAELDEGKRCVACDGTELTRAADIAMCLRCGHRIALSSLRSVVLTSAEIADVTRPDDERRRVGS